MFALGMNLLFASALAVQGDAGAKVYAAVADSVLLIVAQDEKGVDVATGSAFVVADGRLVTSAHVVTEGRIFVRSGAFTVRCVVEKVDVERDLAILKPTTPISAKPLRLSDRTIPPGTTVFAVGNPQGLERTISQGL